MSEKLTAVEQSMRSKWERNVRFRRYIEQGVRHALEKFDPGRRSLERETREIAFNVALEAAAMALSLAFDDDAELRIRQEEVDALRKLALSTPHMIRMSVVHDASTFDPIAGKQP